MNPLRLALLPLDLARISWARSRGHTPPGFLLLLFDLTYRCNLRCRMCDLWRPGADEEPELSFEAIEAALGDAASLGCRVVSFSGGEPLLRDDLPRIIAATRRHGMGAHLDTNGTLLDRPWVEGLRDAGLNAINVSLDGATATTHDALRGVPGAFSRTRSGLEALRRHAPDVPITINTVICSRNLGELEEIADLAHGLGAEAIKFLPINFLPPYNRCGMQDEALALGPEDAPELERRVATLRRHLVRIGMDTNSREYLRGMVEFVAGREHFGLRCFAGYLWLYVDAGGRVLACTPVVDSPGTLHDRSLAELWRSPALEELRGRLRMGQCPGCWDSCYIEPSIRASLRHLVGNPRRVLAELRALTKGGK